MGVGATAIGSIFSATLDNMATKSLEFQLKILHPGRGNAVHWLPALGIVGLLALALPGILLKDNILVVLYELVVLGVGGYYGWLAYRRYAFVEVLIKLMPDRLLVLDEQQYQEIAAVPHAAMTAYKYSHFDGRQELRITRRDAPPLYLRVNGKLVEPGDFTGLVQAFEAKLASYPTDSGVKREKTFFEKPISTWLLLVLTLGLLAAGGLLITRPLPARWGRLVGLPAYYLLYIALWWAARARRREL